MNKLMAALFLTGAITLSLGNVNDDPSLVVLEHDIEQRDHCLYQLLDATDEPLIAGIIIGTINYVDRHYGGPCAAWDHYREHGWY